MGSSYVPSSWPADPERLPWWTEVDPAAACRWRSARIPHVRELFLAASALWVGFAVVLVAVQRHPSAELVPLLLWPTVAIVLGLARVRIPTWLLAMSLLGTAVFVAVAVYASQHATSAPGWTALLFVLMAVFHAAVPLLARPYAVAGKADRAIPAGMRDHRVFGRTGTGLASARGWRRAAVESGLLGEALTGELLDNYVTRIPSARIFHSLAWPGSATADVDHAVLCGQRLVLVDSKRWEPGDYTFDSDGNLMRAGRPFLGSQVRLPHAVAAYQRLLPQCDVRGVVLIHPNRPGTVSISASPWPKMQALTAHGFVTQTCAWLAGQPDMIDTRAVALLWSMTNGPDAPAGVPERKAGRWLAPVTGRSW